MKTIQITPKHYLTFSISIKTEGHNETHTIIPGSTLNGVMASRYYKPDNENKNKNLKQAFHDFHSGLTIFGQGHPVYNGNPCYPVPASWHITKSASATQQSGEALKADDIINLAVTEAPEGEQLVGQRDYVMYATENGFKKLSSTLSEKTGIGIKDKKSDKSIFFINEQLHHDHAITYIAKSNHESDLPKQLQLGKRRNGEQGHVTVETLNEASQIENISLEKGQLLYLWLQTDLLLCDKYGQASCNPEDIGIEGITWLKEKSFFRTDSRCRRNAHYGKWLSDEFFIKAGGVVTFKVEKEINLDESIYKGLYNEFGFGEILVNHPYITEQKPKPLKQAIEINQQQKTIDSLEEDNDLTGWLSSQQVKVIEKNKAIEQLPKYITQLKAYYGSQNNKEPTSTQWSQLYREALARNAENLDNLPKTDALKNVLNKHGLLKSESNSFSNEEWIILQHYSHAAMKIASKTYRELE